MGGRAGLLGVDCGLQHADFPVRTQPWSCSHMRARKGRVTAYEVRGHEYRPANQLEACWYPGRGGSVLPGAQGMHRKARRELHFQGDRPCSGGCRS